MNESDQLLDSVLRREIEFQQTATWLLVALAADLKQLQSEIVGRFFVAPITTMTPATVALLMAEVSDAIDKAYEEIRRRVEQWADDLINVAEEDEKKRTFIAFGWVLPTLSGFTAESLIIQGLGLKEAIQRNADALKFKFKIELNTGTLSDETPDAVLRRVLGIEQFETNAFDLTLNGLETLARTAATTIPAQVKMAQQQASSAQGGASGAETRIFWIWLSLLDMRTCFPKGELILTPKGYRPIESVVEGDLVIGGSRVPRKVLATMCKIAHQIATLKLSNGSIIRCTPDHLFASAGKWIKARELIGIEIDRFVECVHTEECQNPSVLSVKNPSKKGTEGGFAPVIATLLTTRQSMFSNVCTAVRKSLLGVLSQHENYIAQTNVGEHTRLYPTGNVSTARKYLLQSNYLTVRSYDAELEKPALQSVGRNGDAITRQETKRLANLYVEGIAIIGEAAGLPFTKVGVAQTGMFRQIKQDLGTAINVASAARFRNVNWTFITLFLSKISAHIRPQTNYPTWSLFASVATIGKSMKQMLKCCYHSVEKGLDTEAMLEGIRSTLPNSIQFRFCKFVNSLLNRAATCLKSDGSSELCRRRSEAFTYEKSGNTYRVLSVTIADEECEVFDIQVDQDECFIVADVVAHNCKICRARHERQWSDDFQPIGHTLPWMGGPPVHLNCRCSCISLPVGAPAPGEVGFVEWINRQSLDELAQIFGGELAKEIHAGKVTQANIARGAGLSRNPNQL